MAYPVFKSLFICPSVLGKTTTPVEIFYPPGEEIRCRVLKYDEYIMAAS
jgi:hypothetical protein